MHFLSKFVGVLPAIISKIVSLSLSKKVTLVYSRFPTLKRPLTFLGKQSSQLLVIAPLLGGLNASISVMQHCGQLKMLCLSDEQSIQDPKKLLELFDLNMKAVLSE